MPYVVSANDTSGRVVLRRETAAGAIKKAGELIEDACWDVRITAPDGHEYTAGNFEGLAPPNN